ncbi:hypothetical protein L6452_06688 [Arctium lappa]|uniref:Uncharacterized protein n=1 Tax=Arctium lappa TaxID=4217 RepID=A0ACB9EJ92_ARCLA|nr:hypothetical protein L6452_06688 [Arctium lappa]
MLPSFQMLAHFRNTPFHLSHLIQHAHRLSSNVIFHPPPASISTRDPKLFGGVFESDFHSIFASVEWELLRVTCLNLWTHHYTLTFGLLFYLCFLFQRDCSRFFCKLVSMIV